MDWNRVSPVYPVAGVAAAIEWYRRVLGFEPQLVNPAGDAVPVYAVLRRDAVPARRVTGSQGSAKARRSAVESPRLHDRGSRWQRRMGDTAHLIAREGGG